MQNWKSFLVTGAERKLVKRRERFQQHRDASSHQVFISLQGKAPNDIHWMVQFKDGDFSIIDAPRPGRHKLTTPEIIDHIHELILEDRRFSAKSIAKQLDISRERVGSNIHEIWT